MSEAEDPEANRKMHTTLSSEPCLFPRINTNRINAEQGEPIYKDGFYFPDISVKDNLHECLKTAWAVLLAKYTNSCTVRFGMLSEPGRGVSRETIEEWTGSVKADSCAQEACLMTKCHNWSYRGFGYQGRFNTGIIPSSRKGFLAKWAQLPNHPIELVLLLDHSQLRCRISVCSRPTLLDRKFVRLLSVALEHVLHLITGTEKMPLGILDLMPVQHHQQICTWNESAPKVSIDDCIHEYIRRQCVTQPDSQAICAWDGSFTYRELDYHSSRIQIVLEHNGVGSKDVVPLCFEKSKWTPVAILGVLKTGAAFVLLDPSYPINRLQGICHDVKASMVLSSNINLKMSSSLAKMVIEIPDCISTDETEGPTPENREYSTRGNAAHAAYIAYTSGSTGNPKGIVIEHGSFCTNLVASSEAHNLDGSSRVLQFASYAFDVSIHETLVPLMLGGCVCIPSASQRVHRLQDAIMQQQVNWMELTPSVARLFDPDDIPCVKTLVVGGEPLQRADVARWAGRVKLIVAYGPAECTVVSTLQRLEFSDCDPSNVGRAYGGTSWVVEPDNHDKLVPIGAVGELLIGGPIVGRGYLNRPELTEAVFIANSPWMGAGNRGRRFYKTGDLVRQNSDGTFVYLGRKDTQVKLRGQRLELGEIEHHARCSFPNAAIAAEVVKQFGQPILVLFVAWEPMKVATSGNGDNNLLFRRPGHTFLIKAQEAKAMLASVLPPYMVPTFIIPLRMIPLSYTAKVDRKALQSIVSQMSKSELQMCQPRATSTQCGTGIKHQSRLRTHIVQLFSRLLPLAPDDIHDDDDFFQMGGDSMSAITLVSEASNLYGLDLTVAAIFQNPTVSQLCQHIKKGQPLLQSVKVPSNIVPFSLLDPVEVNAYKQLASEQCGVSHDDIEDIYPCTPLQQRLVVGSAGTPGAFQARFTFKVPRTVDWDRLKCAWNMVSTAHPILRTRIIDSGSTKSFQNASQVVVRGEIKWLEASTEAECHASKSQCNRHMAFGTALMYFVVAQDTSHPKLTWVVHHALFDWWSYNLILDAVQRAYSGQHVAPRLFVPFIDQIRRLDKARARDFWRSEFKGLRAIVFPAHRPAGYSPQAVEWACREFSIPFNGQGGATVSTMIRLAWGILVSQCTNLTDVVFGVTMMGRNTHVAAGVTGPTITTYPLRMVLQPHLEVNEALRYIQDHGLSIIPFEQTGMQQIQQVSPEAAIACEFQSLLVVQPPSGSGAQMMTSARHFLDLDNNEPLQRQSYANFSTQIITIVCELKADNLTVNAFFDATILTSEQVQFILQNFEHILDDISQNPGRKLADIIGGQPDPELEFSLPRVRGSWIEIEQKASEYIGSSLPIVAELIVPRLMRASKLVLFVGVCGTATQTKGIFLAPEEHTRARLFQLLTHLQKTLPASIAPSACIPVRVGYKSSTSIFQDRAQLREAASRETWTSLVSLVDPRDAHVYRPLSPLESKIQRILASILQLEPEWVGVDDDFLSLGCDSIIASHFSAQCNRENIMVTIRDIFDTKTVALLSIRASQISTPFLPKVLQNFSLVCPLYGDVDSFKADINMDAKLSSSENMTDAYPCTSPHQGLITPHHSYTIWELSGLGDSIDILRLADAWNSVVNRHAALRTILCRSQSDPTRIFHVVLDSYPVDVKIVCGVENENIQPSLLTPWLHNSGRDDLVYAFTMYTTTTDRVFCKLEGRYAFLDATSVLIILCELRAAYFNTLPVASGSQYDMWVRYLQQWSADDSHLAYWRQYLAGVKPSIISTPLHNYSSNCHELPQKELQSVVMELAETSALRNYCSWLGVGITSVVQLAWALVLQHYTRSADVCFGTLTSGRDAAVPNINDIVGSLFNVLVCRFSLGNKKPLHQIVQEHEHDNYERLSHQYCSLKDVIRTGFAKGEQLFNTCLSVEKPLSSEGAIEFTELETYEETEYDIIVIITVSSESITAKITYWTSALNQTEATTMVEVLQHSLNYILFSPENNLKRKADSLCK
ncbi:NRPS [Myotisia sp. PD_48]|nr:NRPS [Myotisia sp. PD_48]